MQVYMELVKSRFPDVAKKLQSLGIVPGIVAACACCLSGWWSKAHSSVSMFKAWFH